MDMEFLSIQMEIDMKEIIEKTKEKGKVHIFMLVALNILAIIKMANQTDMEYIFTKMEINILANLKMINTTVKEFSTKVMGKF